MVKFYPRERKREEQRREGGAPGREEHVWARRRERERERERGGEGVFMVPTQGSKIPLDLN